MKRNEIKAKADRYKVPQKDSTTLRSKWQAISLGGRIFMLSPVAVLLCYKILDNTISVRYFSLIYGGVGIVLYLILKFFFRKNKSLKFDAWGYVGSFLIFVSVCALLNYITLQPVIKVATVVITDKGESSSRSKQHYIFFNLNKKNQRFTVTRNFESLVDRHEKINMYYQKSLFGFDIVDRFEKQ